METEILKNQLKTLTELFESNITQYKSPKYDEANTRIDFIDKFFAFLDWDIANNQGFSEVYREVCYNPPASGYSLGVLPSAKLQCNFFFKSTML